MSWSRKAPFPASDPARGLRLVPLACALFLAACGFAPLHAQRGGDAVSAAYRDIRVAAIPDREGQYLRNLLIDRIYLRGRPADPRYVLEVGPLETTGADLGIQRDATVTRTQTRITARMRLVDAATGKPVLERTLHSVGGYDVLDAHYATLVVERSATDHILNDLADSIMTELDLYLRGTP